MPNVKFSPLLAETYMTGVQIQFPVIASPKIDGFRCITPNPSFHIFDTSSRSLKPIPNTFTRANTRMFQGLDGELCVGAPNDPETFDRTKVAMTTRAGEPDFSYWIFDLTDVNPLIPFVERYQMLVERYNRTMLGARVGVVEHVVIATMADLLSYEEAKVAEGYEGIMLRDPVGRYKYGRSTLLEGYLIKWKRLDTDEAEIVGFIEQEENLNEAKIDARGLTVRSSHKANKVGKGTLGSFICKSPKWADTFKIGTGEGLTKKLRQEIWDNQSAYLGRKILFEHQVLGSKDRPRIPSWKGFAE